MPLIFFGVTVLIFCVLWWNIPIPFDVNIKVFFLFLCCCPHIVPYLSKTPSAICRRKHLEIIRHYTVFVPVVFLPLLQSFPLRNWLSLLNSITFAISLFLEIFFYFVLLFLFPLKSHSPLLFSDQSLLLLQRLLLSYLYSSQLLLFKDNIHLLQRW